MNREDYLERITIVLSEIPGLASFAVSAIMRETDARISQWLQVNKQLSDETATVELLNDVADETEWEYIMKLIVLLADKPFIFRVPYPAIIHLQES